MGCCKDCLIYSAYAAFYFFYIIVVYGGLFLIAITVLLTIFVFIPPLSVILLVTLTQKDLFNDELRISYWLKTRYEDKNRADPSETVIIFFKFKGTC